MNEFNSDPKGLDFNSILIYLFFFLLSFFFCYLSETMFKRNKKQIGFINAFISIFILCLLASLRSTAVGGDVSVYLLPNFEYAMSSSNFSDFYAVASSQMEVLFSLLVYFFAKIGSLSLLFFTIQFLILEPVYIVLYDNRDNCSITISFIIYVLLFYNFSLSGMRQSIAMSLMYLAINYLFKKDYKKLILLGIISILFHKGAAIPLVLVISIILFENKEYYRKFLFMIAVMLSGVFVFYNKFANILQKIFLVLNPRYSFYIAKYMNESIQWNNIPTTEIVLKLGIVLICCFFGHYKKKRNVRNFSILAFSLLGRFFVLLNARMYEALRVAYYFDIFSITLVGNTIYQQKFHSNKRIISFCMMLLAFAYWIYFIMYIGGYKTNIYTFAWFN